MATYYKKYSSKKYQPRKYVPKKQTTDDEVKEIYLGEADAKTIDLKGKEKCCQLGICDGCGKERCNRRFITKEYLCQECRQHPDYKLITKSTVQRLYPTLDVSELIQACKDKQIQIFYTRNWHNPKAPSIKLYYEREIQELARLKSTGLFALRKSHSKTISKSHSRHVSKSRK